jgi:hypothetical protein
MHNNKITSRPPVNKTAQDFILEAERRGIYESKSEKKESYPWSEGKLRSDVQKVFTVKLLEEYTSKIKYISEITNKSQQKIVREMIMSGIDELLQSMKIDT